MEMDSEPLTPPGSPILGFSRKRDFLSISKEHGVLLNSTDSGRIFHCKGPLVHNDFNFSKEGFFRQQEVNFNIDMFKSSEAVPICENRFASLKCNFFGFDFDLTEEEDLVALVSVFRKRITMAESRNIHSTLMHEENDARNDATWVLRLEIAKLSNFLSKNRGILSHFNATRIMNGLLCTLRSVKEWPTSLQSHCGSGPNCASPEFHLFHLHLEMRWMLLTLFRFSTDMLNWVLEDLLFLVFVAFKRRNSFSSPAAFNCYCVMEFWAMLRLIIENTLPNCVNSDFTSLVKSRLVQMRLDLGTSDSVFPLWLTFHLWRLTGYELNGEMNAALNSSNIGNNDFQFALKEWLSNNNINGSSATIIQCHSLLRHLLPQVEYSLALVMTLWSHWLSQLERGHEIRNMEYFTSSAKWMNLVTRICEQNVEFTAETTDPFHTFLALLVEVSNKAAAKDWQKLGSAICRSITSKFFESFSENGLTRIISLLLCLSFVGRNNTSTIEICQRLNEVLNYGKDSLRLLKIRGRCAMILLLLHKGLSVETCCVALMKNVDDIMGTIHRSPVERDMIMVYWDLIQNLPLVSPHSDLNQSKLISVNLTPWLASCGSNYLVRTLRILHSMFGSWILNTNTVPTMEKSKVANLLLERMETFIQQSVAGDFNNVDVEPFADIAVDLTVFQKMNRNYKEANKLFLLCSLSPQTSPKISEVYLDRLISNIEFEERGASFASEIQLAQSWIRLVTLGCAVPVKLTAKLLRPNASTDLLEPFSSATSDVLMRKFLDFVNSSDCYWNKEQIVEILRPISSAVKIAIENKAYDADTMEHVVRSSVLVMQKIQLDKIYSRNFPGSFVIQILEGFVPSFLRKPPWEKLSTPLVKSLEKNLPDIFIFIYSTDWANDSFLKRKLFDTFRFAFLGFITTVDLEDGNPGLLIMRHLEVSQQTPDSLLQELMTNLHLLIREDALVKRFLLTVFGYLKQKMTVTSSWLFGLVLELMSEKDNEICGRCHGVLVNCIIQVLNARDKSSILTERLRTAFDSTMTKHFSFRSKRFFDFFNIVLKQANKKSNVHVLTFLHKAIIPLLNTHVRLSEAKQGSVVNHVMRNQLQLLETKLMEATQTVKTQHSF